jgi:hypothetical protein
MDLALQLTSYNKNLPVWYHLSSVLKRSIYYWSVSVSDYFFPRFSQGSSLTFVRVKVESISDRTGLGSLVSPCSKCVNICC